MPFRFKRLHPLHIRGVLLTRHPRKILRRRHPRQNLLLRGEASAGSLCTIAASAAAAAGLSVISDGTA